MISKIHSQTIINLAADVQVEVNDLQTVNLPLRRQAVKQIRWVSFQF